MKERLGIMLKSISKEDLIFGLILTYVFLIPCSPFFSVRVLVFTAAISLIDFKTTIPNILKSWNALLMLAVLAAGLIYTSDQSQGLKVLETSASLVLVPISFSGISSRWNTRNLHRVALAFLVGVVAASLICLVIALANYLTTANLEVFTFYNLTSTINSHPTYFAYYLIFAITIVLFDTYNQVSSINLWGKLFLILFLIIVLLLTGGLTSYISLVLIFAFYVLRLLLAESNTNQKMTVAFVIFGAFLVMSVYQRNFSSIMGQGDSWDRLTTWTYSLHANDDLIWGVGTGDYENILNRFYLQNGMPELAKASHNSHNQFLHILLSNGFIGLLAFLALLGRPLYLSMRNSDSLGVLVFFPFIIYGITEVFLGRYQGVVFYSLLNEIFCTYYQKTVSN